MTRFASILAVMLAGNVAAVNMPPYEVYPYLADATDNPPVNYMMVVEPDGETSCNNFKVSVEMR